MKLGYISNGFSDHTLPQMVEVLHRFGYSAIGLTLGAPHLDPFTIDRQSLLKIRELFDTHQLQPAIETGARYALDGFRKHRPSLVSVDRTGREQRVTYYKRAIDLAVDLGAKVVSIWSGTPQPGIDPETTWRRLVAGLTPVLDHAERMKIKIGFEPEPGMFIEDLEGWSLLKKRLPHLALGLTIDIGHLAVTEEEPWDQHLEVHAEDLVHLHLDDAKNRRHEHLLFGEGEIDWDAIFATLERIEYGGVALVELSRHSHVAPLMAQRSILFLRSAILRAREEGSGSGTDL